MIKGIIYAGAVYDTIKFRLGYTKNFVLPNNIFPLLAKGATIYGRAITARGRKTSTPDPFLYHELLDEFPLDGIYILQANDNSRISFRRYRS